jgi:hypothetical protein
MPLMPVGSLDGEPVMTVPAEKGLPFSEKIRTNRLLLFVLLLSVCAKPAPAGQIDKAFVSFRIGIGQSLPEERYRQLLDLLERYRGVADEITFFTSITHPPIPLEVFQERMETLAERMKQAREKGYRAGINILSTIGHHDENLENSLKGNYTPATDIQGRVCQGSLCPNDENLRRYVRRIYQLTARADPDYIWLDDDIRLAGHWPIYLTCFCDHCLAIFATETGKKYTRDGFRKAVDEGTVAEKLTLRKAWLQHNRDTIARLFGLIEETVHRIRPDMPLGFMTGDRFYEGYDFERWANMLAGPNHVPVRWRPGGGFYQDGNTAELAGKSHDIGRQVSRLPDDVLSIQSEIENFPYQPLKKAASIVVLEACSHIAAGCTGAAYNVLSMNDEPLAEFEPLIARLQRARPFLDLLAKSLGRLKPAGIHTFWNRDSFVTANLAGGSWFDPAALLPRHELYDIGLPACYSEKHASVVILGKNSIYALAPEEIRDLLSRGVYMDAETLQQLNEMGFGDLTGFAVVRADETDRIEKFSGHPLNSGFAGRVRDNRQSFPGWNSPAYVLRTTGKNAQTLSGLTDYSDRNIAPCAMGIFENRLGGRICVAGYYPWTYLESLSKSSQMKSLFRWLSRDRLPGYVASFHKINLWIRQPRNGRTTLALTNSSFDPAENVVLMLRTENREITVFDMDCRPTVIRSSEADGVYQKFVIPHVDSWQSRLVIAEPRPDDEGTPHAVSGK